MTRLAKQTFLISGAGRGIGRVFGKANVRKAGRVAFADLDTVSAQN